MRVFIVYSVAALLRRTTERAEEEKRDAILAQFEQFAQTEASLKLDSVDLSNSTTGFHQCSCVSDADEQRQDLKNLRWLHFPKTGTSFWSSVYSYACRAQGPLDMDVSPFWKKPGCASCYDFAIKERYPPEKYCADGSFASMETQHKPMQPNSPEQTVTFFRDPTDRLLSAAGNQHTSGFLTETYQAMIAKCYHPKVDPHCFANFPGIKGCMTRMLTGGSCADDGASKGTPFPVNTQAAIAAVNRLAFLGLTEEWNDSVCLFHKMFGGRVTQAEFKNFHPSLHETPDADIIDHEDEPVYLAAKARFAALKKQYGAETCHRIVPTLPTCEPRTCEVAGAECGTIDDGCGGKMVCGQCPQHRAGPATCGATTCHSNVAQAPGTFAVSSYMSHV